MKQKEIYELMQNNPIFHLATMEEDQPRVRGMMLYKADENGIVFHTSALKPLYKQIKSNSKAELCFWDMQRNIQVRVTGILEEIEDNDVKDEIYSHPSRSFLKGLKESGTLEEFYKNFIVLKLQKGSAVVWTMETNLMPKETIVLD